MQFSELLGLSFEGSPPSEVRGKDSPFILLGLGAFGLCVQRLPGNLENKPSKLHVCAGVLLVSTGGTTYKLCKPYLFAPFQLFSCPGI